MAFGKGVSRKVLCLRGSKAIQNECALNNFYELVGAPCIPFVNSAAGPMTPQEAKMKEVSSNVTTEFQISFLCSTSICMTTRLLLVT